MFAVRSRLRALRDEHGRRALGQGAVGRLLFGWANRGKSPVYLAYRPDSQFIFHSHTEADAVMDRWLAGNSIYNGGDLPRLYSLVLNIKQTIADNVPGDFAELGVYKGNTAAVLCDLAAACGRRVFLFDTFSGFDDRDLDLETNPCEHQFGDTFDRFRSPDGGSQRLCGVRCREISGLSDSGGRIRALRICPLGL